MKDEQAEELYGRLKDGVSKKDRERLKVALESCGDEKYEELKKCSPISVFHDLKGVLLFIGTLLGALIITVNLILYAWIGPHYTEMSQFSVRVASMLDKQTAVVQKIGNNYLSDDDPYEELADYKTLTADYKKKKEEYEDADEAYNNKVAEYKTAVAFVNDKHTNRDAYQLEIAKLDSTAEDYQTKKEGYKAKIAEYDTKKSGLTTLYTQCTGLRDERAQKLEACASVAASLGALHIGYENGLSVETKTKLYALSGYSGELSVVMSAEAESLATQLTAYKETHEKYVADEKYLNEESNTVKEKFSQDKTYCEGMLGQLNMDVEQYVTVTNVGLYNAYAQAIADDTDDSKQSEVSNYLLSESVLKCFALDGYAELSQKPVESQSDEEKAKLAAYEKLIADFKTPSKWTVDEYVEKAKAISTESTAEEKAAVAGYVSWAKGTKAANDLFSSFDYDKEEAEAYEDYLAYGLAAGKNSLIDNYYGIEHTVLTLTVLNNYADDAMDGVAQCCDAINGLSTADRAPRSYKKMLDKTGFGDFVGSVKKLAEDVNKITVEENAFKINGIDYDVKTYKPEDLSEKVNAYGFALTAERYGGSEGGVADINKEIAYYTELGDGQAFSSEFVHVLMVPYNAIASAIMICYFIGCAVILVRDRNKKNLEDILSITEK